MIRAADIGCVRAAELEAALDERLAPADRAKVLQHALTCAQCREAQRRHQRLRTLAREAPPPPVDALAAQRVRARLVEHTLRGRTPSTRATWPLALAACAVAAVGAGAWHRTHRAAAPVATTAVIDLSGAGTLTPMAGASYRVLRAGDDTRVMLRDGSIALAVAHRRVGQRFVIATRDAEVEVRGTRFTVEATASRLRRVVVTEGVVAVRVQGAPERVLFAGERFTAGASEVPTGAVTAVAQPAQVAEPTPTAAPTVTSPPRAPHGVETAHAATQVSRDFREGALAYVRGEPARAVVSLRRFLATAPTRDARREDATYVMVLALDATHDGGFERAARAYLADFPDGVRRAEVTARLVRSLARRGECDAAARAVVWLPDDASPSLREQVAHALTTCGAHR